MQIFKFFIFIWGWIKKHLSSILVAIIAGLFLMWGSNTFVPKNTKDTHNSTKGKTNISYDTKAPPGTSNFSDLTPKELILKIRSIPNVASTGESSYGVDWDLGEMEFSYCWHIQS